MKHELSNLEFSKTENGKTKKYKIIDFTINSKNAHFLSYSISEQRIEKVNLENCIFNSFFLTDDLIEKIKKKNPLFCIPIKSIDDVRCFSEMLISTHEIYNNYSCEYFTTGLVLSWNGKFKIVKFENIEFYSEKLKSLFD